MKSSLVIALSSLVLSFSAQAGGPTEIQLPPAQAKDVKYAVRAEVMKHYLACTVTLGDYSSSDEMLNILRNFLSSDDAVVYETSDQSQPVITVALEDAYSSSTLAVTTSADFKSITSVRAVGQRLQTVVVNTGTLLNPVYTQEVVGTTVTDFMCK